MKVMGTTLKVPKTNGGVAQLGTAEALTNACFEGWLKQVTLSKQSKDVSSLELANQVKVTE